MSSSLIVDIADACLALDTMAVDIYRQLATNCQDDALTQFWQSMADEEKTHVELWKTLKRLAMSGSLPDVFDDPARILNSLRSIAPKVRTLKAECHSQYDARAALLIAYRLEFYFLNPSFPQLLQILATETDLDPVEAYEAHILRFVKMFASQGAVSVELELMGETLQRLWTENRRLAQQAVRDPLTGIFNRRGFMSAAIPFAHLAERRRSLVCAILIDIDDFKLINDRFGHDVGDTILKRTAKVLSDLLRASDVLGRYGGEEFVAFLTLTQVSDAAAIGEKIRTALSKESSLGALMSVSTGVAVGRLKSDVRTSLRDLILSADAAMYAAKTAGKNRYIIDMIDGSNSETNDEP